MVFIGGLSCPNSVHFTLPHFQCSLLQWRSLRMPPPLKVPQEGHHTWHKAARNAEGGCLSGLFSVSNNCWRVTKSLDLTMGRSSAGSRFSQCSDPLQYPSNDRQLSEPSICSVTTRSSQGSRLRVATERSKFGIRALPCPCCVTLS